MKQSFDKAILFWVPYPIGVAPGQRFRFEHYLSHLEEKGFTIRINPFWSPKAYDTLYRKGFVVRKVWYVLVGSLRRCWDVFRLTRFDWIYVYREVAPVGPPVFEFIATKIFRRKIIYDFDDAIWLPATSRNNVLARIVKSSGKVKRICTWATRINVGNPFLAEFARMYSPNVHVIPTVVDTERHHVPSTHPTNRKLTVGWTGSNSTLPYIEPLIPVIRRLQKRFDFTWLVIADQNPKCEVRDYEFIKWSADSEIQDLARMDIGVMPLEDNDWNRGKCGFKAIQYLAMRIPAVVSPVGVNSRIVTEGENGFLCTTEHEWEEKLSLLLEDGSTRKRMGINGREKVESYYSVKSTRAEFIDLFTSG